VGRKWVYDIMKIEKNIYKDEKKNIYKVKITVNGKTRETSASTLEHARRLKRLYQSEIYAEQREQLETFESFKDVFLVEKAQEDVAYSTIENYRQNLDTISRYIAERKLKEMNDRDWKNVFHIIKVNQKLKNSTLNKYIDSVRALCNHFDIHFSSRKYKQETDNTHRRNFYVDEMKIFLSTAKKYETLNFYVLFSMYFFTGARRSELLALTWDDIDFRFSRITINKSLQEQKGGTIVAPTKTKQSRTFPVASKKMMGYLKELYDDRKSEYVFYNDTSCTRVKQRQHNFLSGKTVERHFKKILEIARLDTTLSLHSCRHTFATMALANNNNVKDIQLVGGWANSSTLLNVYAHSLESGVKKITNNDSMF
jgi:integrase